MPGASRVAMPATSLYPPKPATRPIPISTPFAAALDKAAVEEGGAGDGWELEDGAEEEGKGGDVGGESDGDVAKAVLGGGGDEESKVEASSTRSGPGRGV